MRLIPSILLLTLIIYGCSASSNFSPTGFEKKIITVEQWGGTSASRGEPANNSLARKQTIKRITLHHQGESFPEGSDPIQYLRNLQSWSRKVKHWIDIPYHYIIDLKGNVYEGRKIDYTGDTNTEYDPTGHALIEVVGNFEEVEPNQLQLDAIVKTMAWLSFKYNVPVDSIRSHRDYSSQTVCPGKNLYKYFQNGYFHRKVEECLNNIFH